jgi:hypothetical protein
VVKGGRSRRDAWPVAQAQIVLSGQNVGPWQRGTLPEVPGDAGVGRGASGNAKPDITTIFDKALYSSVQFLRRKVHDGTHMEDQFQAKAVEARAA